MFTKDISEQFRKYKSDNEIYHDLMQFRIREILLVATTYDAFILEQEGQLSEQIFGEYYNLNLTSAPRVTSVHTSDEALQLILTKKFDMVILTIRMKGMNVFELASNIKSYKPATPVFLLLYDNHDIMAIGERGVNLKNIDRVFVWNRDTKIFLAMSKYVEDRKNADNDTKVGLVRIILLVENSIRYYSRYLPVLYTEIFHQTHKLISEESASGMGKILRMHVRPKVLMAVNYEEAVEVFNKYKDYMLCVISDIKFPKDGILDDDAGFKLIEYVKSQNEDLPVLLQSSDAENEYRALEYGCEYMNKNSESLSSDLSNFIVRRLGFGNFNFRDHDGNIIAVATTLKSFREKFSVIPIESVIYHALRNHFSAWLMARGEIRVAKLIQPIQASDFKTPEDLRMYLLDIFEDIEFKGIKGKVPKFDESLILRDNYIVRLSDGSLGGKGRGIAFVNNLIENSNLSDYFSDVNFHIPKTAIIGTEEFDNFIRINNFNKFIFRDIPYIELERKFLKARLSNELITKLYLLLSHLHAPIAVRSSSLFEDSITESFSGIYETYLLPNNDYDINVRLDQLQSAIKLIYASVFSKVSRSYFDAINYKLEEEKMAIVLQEVIGDKHETRFYPHISGVAESYNYYPVSYMKPKDGIVVMAAGLGKYVIDGENSYRFCPKFPNLEMNTPEEILHGSQNFLYAIDMSNTRYDLINGDDITLKKVYLEDAEYDGILEHIASVWDEESGRICAGLVKNGPRIVDFAHILKYNYCQLAQALNMFLEAIQDFMGMPVEIEFAVKLNENSRKNNGISKFGYIPAKNNKKSSLYILQVKPLIRKEEEFELDENTIDMNNVFLYTHKGMGNGMIDDIYDIIYCDPTCFDKSKTVEMANEIEMLNNRLRDKNKKYILIGPGRWGTRDRWLGIPVVWTQISNAKIIVETSLEDFFVDASLGSHFFHNITSMNIGYFTVHNRKNDEFIDWSWLYEKTPDSRTKYFCHCSFDKPLKVLMDGKKSISLIYK